MPVPSVNAPLFVSAFAAYNPSITTGFTSLGQTSRVNLNSGTINHPLLIQEAAGGTVVDFTAAAPGNKLWGAAGVGLLGLNPAYDSVGSAFTGYLTNNSYTHTLVGSPTAIVAAAHIARNPAPSPTLGLTANGTPMVELAVNPFYPRSALHLFGLIGTFTSPVTIASSTPLQSAAAVNSVAYTGVSDFDDAVINSYFNSDLIIQSTRAASRAVAFHAMFGPSPVVQSYSQIKRAVLPDPLNAAYQSILAGDAPGAPIVTSSVQLSAAKGVPNCVAIGVDIAPAPVMLNVAAKFGPVLTAARLADYRVADPSPQRMWVIPDVPGKTPDELGD
jgi:hypothetical protein